MSRNASPCALGRRGSAGIQDQAQTRSCRTTVASRDGPTPTAEMRAPDIASTVSTYARALAGRSSKVRA